MFSLGVFSFFGHLICLSSSNYRALECNPCTNKGGVGVFDLQASPYGKILDFVGLGFSTCVYITSLYLCLQTRVSRIL